MSIPEEKIEAFRVAHKRVKVVSYNGHEMVFRKPSRMEAKQYTKKLDDPQAKLDADEQFAQTLIVYFDGIEGKDARAAFTAMLDDFPHAGSSKDIGQAMSQLSGLVQDEDLKGSGASSTTSGGTPVSSQTV